MSLDDVIARFITGTYPVKRRAASTYDANGRLVAGAITTLNLDAVVQPPGGRELQRLPEGMRTKEIRAVWTTVQLMAQSSTQDPDLITIDGADWEVQLTFDRLTDGAYFKALAIKV